MINDLSLMAFLTYIMERLSEIKRIHGIDTALIKTHGTLDPKSEINHHATK